MRILLIEPNAILADVYKKALTQAGHKVERQVNAQESILGIDKNKPDLILLELNLPGHNGVEFLYELRSYPEWQEMPIIIHSFLSAEDLPISSSVKEHLGIVAHLYKPQTSLEKLVGLVDDFVPVAVS